ncbi:phage baseplate assembly protein V [Rhodopseudomonas faecalis]|nr:phage baseplate assembly protein V [Rhodopseudomonas faecalis]
MTRVAEIERKLDGMFRHGRVAARKYDDDAKRWHVRLRVGGTDAEPMLGPWVPYSQVAFGNGALNVHYVPQVGAQMTMLSPAGDPQQAVAIPLTWWSDHPAPSKDPGAVVATFGKVQLTVKDGVVEIAVGQIKLRVTGDRVETIGATFLGLDSAGEGAPRAKVDPDQPAKQVFAKV